ncbi:hypothetical protein [Paenibacillus aceti]|uniref:Uncharacterized protein n=1 Tax=Paenibacillus aceti TaxID=1820010 RepID=A0ABQ1VSJ3_9BACL|nr:hypothetical protein [Paenibacillus aceti]GGF95585.1 hypothetical protein GCM10010913_16480 [Paenibacillus aceti]
MIESLTLMLLLIIYSLRRDWPLMRQKPKVNRWITYSLMGISLLILGYTTSGPIFYPTLWLQEVLRPLVPFR